MNTLTNKLSNGNEITYQLINAEKSMPIAYHASTDIKVINAIENARKNRTRIKVYLGEVLTGKCWNEENDTMGYIGLSKGKEAYYPILVNNERSMGGGSLMDDCIIKIRESKGKHVLYQSENFKQSEFEIKEGCWGYQLFIDGELYSNHSHIKSAELLKSKLS